jgi:Sec-independent protein translocase protein TatA
VTEFLLGVLAMIGFSVAYLFGRKRRSAETLERARVEAGRAIEESRRAAEDEVAASRARSDQREAEGAAQATREREALDARTDAREDASAPELADEANRILDDLERRGG